MRFYFLWFHTMAIRFIFFRWYEKNFSCHLKRPDFYGHVHLSWKSSSFSALLIDRSPIEAETPVPCSCLQKLIGPGMTQAVGLHSSWFELRNLGTCVFSVVSSVGEVWEVQAYINENSTHRSETKITDKCFKKNFSYFYTLYSTRKNILTMV